MHVYLRTADGKRGRYIGFMGTTGVRDLSGKILGESYPPHWGFWKRVWTKR